MTNRIIGVAFLVFVISAITALTEWVDVTKMVPPGSTVLSNQEMVCSSSEHEVGVSGRIDHINAWHPTKVRWHTICMPVGELPADAIAAAMVIMLFENGCGGSPHCYAIDIYRDGVRVDSEYSWLQDGQ